MLVKYDLHIHSCLSPCGDDEMLPSVIAGLAKLGGLSLVALTDHNTAGNCRAFSLAASEYGIAALYGAELTTAEDIHVLCLFETVEAAEKFSAYIASHRMKIENDASLFGNQLYVNEDDVVTGRESILLIPATEISFSEAHGLVESFGGVAIPAHIDRESNGALAMLGFIDESDGYRLYELSGRGEREKVKSFLYNPEMPFIRNSDAHTVEKIGSAGGEIELDCREEEIAHAFFQYLKSR